MSGRSAGVIARASVSTERASIVAWLYREGYSAAAKRIEHYADRERPEPTIPAAEWMNAPSVGH
jgi:hypothetical protein